MAMKKNSGDEIAVVSNESHMYKYYNPFNKTIYLQYYSELFNRSPKASHTRKITSEINKWVKYLDPLDAESMMGYAFEYKDAFDKNITSEFYFLQAVLFLVNVKAGLSKFDAWIDTNLHKEEAREWRDNVNRTPRRRKNIMNAVAAYSNRPIVLKLAAAMSAPIELEYHGYKHQMIEVLRDIAVNGTSQRERVNAANSLLQHLNPTELADIRISMKKEKTFIEQAQDALMLLAQKKLSDIQDGVKVDEVINVDVIEEASKLLEQQSKLSSDESSQGGDDSLELNEGKEEYGTNS